jgi:aminopeptidase N
MTLCIVFQYTDCAINFFSDMIAVPNFWFGAMENWGLIIYQEQNLLWDPSTSSEVDKQQTTAVIAHELAHQV